MANVTKSHFKIYEYWANKVITPDGDIKENSEDIRTDDRWVVEDDYYPRCWACGRPVVSDNKFDRWIKGLEDANGDVALNKLWNHKDVRSALQRCHIKPGSLGGEDVVSNLFLMCPDCHEKSPDTIYRNSFFKWVVNRRKETLFGEQNPNYILGQVDELLRKDYNITLADLLGRIGEKGKQEAVVSLGDFMENRVGPHGPKFVESSRILLLEQWLLSIYTNSVLD